METPEGQVMVNMMEKNEFKHTSLKIFGRPSGN